MPIFTSPQDALDYEEAVNSARLLILNTSLRPYEDWEHDADLVARALGFRSMHHLVADVRT